MDAGELVNLVLDVVFVAAALFCATALMRWRREEQTRRDAQWRRQRSGEPAQPYAVNPAHHACCGAPIVGGGHACADEEGG